MRVGGMSSVDVFCGPHGASGVGSEFMSSTFAVDEPRSERPIAPNMPPPFFIAHGDDDGLVHLGNVGEQFISETGHTGVEVGPERLFRCTIGSRTGDRSRREGVQHCGDGAAAVRVDLVPDPGAAALGRQHIDVLEHLQVMRHGRL